MPPPKSPIIKWLAEQDNFEVTQADLTIVDAITQQTFALRDLHLTIRNRNNLRRLSAAVDLPPAIGQRLQLELAADGDPLGAQWNGTLNFRLEQLSAEYASEQLSWRGGRTDALTMDLTGWSRWSDAQMQSMRFTLNAGTAESVQLNTQGQLVRRDAGWLLQLADLALPQRARSAPLARISAAWDGPGTAPQAVVARGSNVPLLLLTGAAAGLAPLSDALREAITSTNPSGLLHDIDAAWRRADQPAYFADARVRQLAFDQYGEIPALSGLEGDINVRTNGSKIVFLQYRVQAQQQRAPRLDAGRVRLHRHTGLASQLCNSNDQRQST